MTEVEGIGRTYAIQNTTTRNDALRALQHDVDAISDQLNRQRDDLKYDEELLKRANEWRAEAELAYDYRQWQVLPKTSYHPYTIYHNTNYRKNEELEKYTFF